MEASSSCVLSGTRKQEREWYMPEPEASGDDLAIAEQPITVNILKKLAGTPAIPKRWKSVSDMVAAVMYGAQVGLAPLESLHRLYVIGGAVAIDSKGMNALVHAAGHVLITKELTTTNAVVIAMRRDPYTHELLNVGEFEYEWSEAEAAGLDQQETYLLYPKDMMIARAVSRATKVAFPDVTTGMLLPQEHDVNYSVVDIGDEEAATALLEATLDADVVSAKEQAHDEGYGHDDSYGSG